MYLNMSAHVIATFWN